MYTYIVKATESRMSMYAYIVGPLRGHFLMYAYIVPRQCRSHEDFWIISIP